MVAKAGATMRTERTAIFDKTPGSLLRHFRIFGFTILGGLTRAHFADWLRRSGICDVTAADLERIESNRQAMPQSLRQFVGQYYPALRETVPSDLRTIRESLGWSQERPAVELDVSRELISKCEAGERSVPPAAATRLRELVPKREEGTTGRPSPICTNEMPCFKGATRGQKRGSETSATTAEAA
jgi:DNA-binding transcriptional regulator YiaG